MKRCIDIVRNQKQCNHIAKSGFDRCGLHLRLRNNNAPVAEQPVVINESDIEYDDVVYECACCFGEYMECQMIRCSEGHMFCANCLSKYVVDRVTGGETALHCMAVAACTGTYSHALLSKRLESRLYDTYTIREFQESLNRAAINNLYQCPKCEFAVIIDDIIDNRFVCMNAKCGYISCIRCHALYHLNTACGTASDANIRTTIEEIFTRNKMRNCPACAQEFTRIDGCNKMTCVCGAKSCYLCRQRVQDYTHFYNDFGANITAGKCPLYTRENDISRIAFELSVTEIYNTYSHDTSKLADAYSVVAQLSKPHMRIVNRIFGI